MVVVEDSGGSGGGTTSDLIHTKFPLMLEKNINIYSASKENFIADLNAGVGGTVDRRTAAFPREVDQET